MKKNLWNTTRNVIISAGLIVGMISPYTVQAASVLKSDTAQIEELLSQTDVEDGDTVHPRAVIYNCDTCMLMTQPDGGSGIVTLYSGQQVYLLRQLDATDQGLWYEVSVNVNDTNYTGCLPADYILCNDYEKMDMMIMTGHQNNGESSFEKSIAGFPESYKEDLRALHASHPNWIFVKQTTNIDWNDFIANEMVQARNLVPRNMADAYKGKQSWAIDPATGDYIGLSGENWVQASEEAVKYYADPRNFLTDNDVFQFELLTYNSKYQTEAGVENILSDTFMANTIIPNDIITYGQAFCRIGKEKNVSPYMLAARVRQEQGAGGTSPLISGTYPGYEGLYNYYNIHAYGSTAEEIYVNGLSYAREQGWTTRYNSLIGGADTLSSKYISRGQDTLYLQKFDVDSSYDGVYWHQYMQNLLGADNEGRQVYKTYSALGILNNSFIFKIPVYKNMPITACAKPGGDSLENEKLVAFIERLYKNMLGRKSDPDGMYHWYTGLQSGSMTAAEVVRRFVNSPEFTKKGLSDEDYIECMYATLMNRKSDPSGKQHWLEILEGGSSRDYVLARFVVSAEFTGICDKYGVKKGYITLTEERDQNVNVTQFVTRLYSKALNRKPDVTGLNHWTGLLLKKQVTPEAVAERIIMSDEFKKHNYSDEDYIKILYRAMLGREADKKGLAHWIEELDRGCTRQEILTRFANSQEFKEIKASYGFK